VTGRTGPGSPTGPPGLRLAAIEVGLFILLLGVPDGILGVLWPSMRRDYGRPVGDLGLLALAGTIPYLVASASAGRSVRRVGFGALMVAALVLGAGALGTWALAPSWVLVVAAVAVFGLSRGAADAGVNAYASEHEGVRRLGLLHAAYGIGAAAAPVLATAVLADGGGWRLSLGAVAAAAAILAAFGVRARRAWALPGAGRRGSTGDAAPVSDFRAAGIAAMLVMFALYTAVEGSTGAWAFTVSTEGRGLGRGPAGLALASYWGALTGGRLVLAAVGGRVARGRILTAGALLAVVALTWFWRDPGGTGVVALPLAGLALGPMFPVLISLVPDRVDAARAAHVVGWCVAAAAVGGPLYTALAGAVADAHGTNAIPPLLVAGSIGLLGAHAALTVAARSLAPAA
jgi:fucose permease